MSRTVDSIRVWMARPVMLVYAAILIALVGHTSNKIWPSPDIWVWLGPIREFAARPFNPHHPLLIGPAEDPYMNPYTLLVGLASRVVGIGAISALQFAAVANAVLLIWSLTRLARRVSDAPAAAALTVVFTLFAWGFRPWTWAGFFNANSIGTVLPLGSTFASAIALLGLSASIDWRRTGRSVDLAVVGLAVPIALLSHPLSFAWAAALGVGYHVGRSLPPNKQRQVLLGGVSALGVLVALVWPFYPLLDLLDGGGEFDAPNRAMFANVLLRTVLAVPGLFLIGRRLIRDRRDSLGLSIVLPLLIYIAAWVLDRGTFGRVLPGVVLACHLAMADELARALQRDRAVPLRKSVPAGLVAFVVLLGALGSFAGFARAVPRSWLPGDRSSDSRWQSVLAPFDGLDRLIGHDEAIAASPGLDLQVAATSGKVLITGLPAPFRSNIEERRSDADVLLDPSTAPTERKRLISALKIRWFVIEPDRFDALSKALRTESVNFRVADARPTFVVIELI